MPNWLLPENIADVLPSEARKIEELRRLMLDNFRLYGYELVMPPLLEYLESLLTGAGKDTDLRTFKLVDQLSGRMLGLRADMTTQVARIQEERFFQTNQWIPLDDPKKQRARVLCLRDCVAIDG